MHPATISFLLDLNRQFYQTFGRAFAATRRRIQPGARRVLDALGSGDYLDLGCGGGTLAAAWTKSGPGGSYTGLDFSQALLDEARLAVAGRNRADLVLRFLQADLSDPAWAAPLAGQRFDGALAFAVLHHLPSAELRLDLLRQVGALLKPGGTFAHSEWQFQHSPRLMERRVPWQQVGVDPAELEPGDTLLDWRYALEGQPEQRGLRYVHLFERTELAELARASGFALVEEFESDGQGGRLGLYQVWRAGTVTPPRK